jgi:hypothetical protein
VHDGEPDGLDPSSDGLTTVAYDASNTSACANSELTPPASFMLHIPPFTCQVQKNSPVY